MNMGKRTRSALIGVVSMGIVALTAGTAEAHTDYFQASSATVPPNWHCGPTTSALSIYFQECIIVNGQYYQAVMRATYVGCQMVPESQTNTWYASGDQRSSQGADEIHTKYETAMCSNTGAFFGDTHYGSHGQYVWSEGVGTADGFGYGTSNTTQMWSPTVQIP